jgi:hypothetical protein
MRVDADLASRLVQTALAWARATNVRCRAVSLHVKASNDDALRFMPVWVFVSMDRCLPNHYRIGDQLQFRWTLSAHAAAADADSAVAIDLHDHAALSG